MLAYRTFLLEEWIVVEVWIVKYKDGKMVGHGGRETSTVADARQFGSRQDAEVTATALNKGLQESHLGYAVAERLS